VNLVLTGGIQKNFAFLWNNGISDKTQLDPSEHLYLSPRGDGDLNERVVLYLRKIFSRVIFTEYRYILVNSSRDKYIRLSSFSRHKD
jgi:hypothetical protein